MKIFWFYHIAKTGGSFVEQNLRNLATSLSGATFFNIIDGVEPDEVINLIKKLPSLPEEYIFVHHHTVKPSLLCVQPELEKCKKLLNKSEDSVFIFSCLREPIARITSAVNYWALTLDPHTGTARWKANGPDKPTFASWLIGGQRDVPQGRRFVHFLADFQSRVLLGLLRSSRAPSKKEIQNILSCMDAVYVTENMGEMEHDLKEIISDKNFCWNPAKRHVTNQMRSRKPDGTKGKHQTIFMTEEEKIAFLEHNKIDSWMYDYVIQMNLRRNKNGIQKESD